MNSHEFVDVIDKVVLESTIRGIKELLEEPPGRAPDKDLIEMSTWYNQLDERQQKVVFNLISMSARHAVLGFLCVLDGLIAIENRDKGVLRLYYERRDEKVLLNDRRNINLSELL